MTLNGAGLRLKVVFQVYAAGLYLGDKAVTPEAALAASGPKRLHLVMLREIDANELGRLFTKGMEMNAQRDEFSKSITGLLRMSDLFSRYKKMQPGETLTVDWQPGVGTVIIINGKADGAPIKEPEFHTALMKIWLGKAPVDPQLKEALLGRAPVAVNPAANYN